MNEEQIPQNIINIINGIASDTWIPGYTKEDIFQEACIIYLLVKDKYPEKFIGLHIRNRLRSLRRAVWTRPKCSCGDCAHCLNEDQKKKVRNPILIDVVLHDKAYEEFDYAAFDELEKRIDEAIPASLREDYLKLLDGSVVSSFKKEKIRIIIQGILDAQ